MEKFEIEKKYWCREIGDHTLTYKFEIAGRTACTIKIKGENGNVKTLRIDRGASEYFGKEIAYPFGKGSKMPVLKADRKA